MAEQAKKLAKTKRALDADELWILSVISVKTSSNLYELVDMCGLSSTRFFDCIDTLVKQRYLKGDVLFGFRRTNKTFPICVEPEQDNATPTTSSVVP